MKNSLKTMIASIALIQLMACGSSSSTTSSTTVTDSSSSQAVVSAVAESFTNVSSLLSSASSANLVSSRYTETTPESLCNHLELGDDNIMLNGQIVAGTYGSQTDGVTLIATDGCTDENRTPNSGDAADSLGRYAQFYLVGTPDITCTDVTETSEMISAKGVVRLRTDGKGEIHGEFTFASGSLNCSIIISGDSEIESTSCTNAAGTTENVTQLATCTLGESDVTLETPFKGQWGLADSTSSDPSMGNLAYDCLNNFNTGEDASGNPILDTDCSKLTDNGINLVVVDIKGTITPSGDTWEFSNTPDIETMARQIKILHANGIQAMVALDYQYDADSDGQIDDSVPFDEDMVSNESFQSLLLNNINEYLDVAVDLNTELIAPLGEAERVMLTTARASEFLQSWRTGFDTDHPNYSGKLVINLAQVGETTADDLDATGFDIVTITTSPMNETMEVFDQNYETKMDNLKALATTEGIGYMNGSLGIWGVATETANLVGDTWTEDAYVEHLIQEGFSYESTLGDSQGIIIWEGIDGEVQFQNYPTVMEMIQTQFTGS